MYIRCDDKFGSCKKSFSWLGQKVNNMATMPTTPARTFACGHGMTLHSSKTFRHCGPAPPTCLFFPDWARTELSIGATYAGVGAL